MSIRIAGFMLIAILAVSCGNSKKDSNGQLADKKAELAKLKKEQQETGDKIIALEKEIAKLDPASAVVTAKLVTVTPVSVQQFQHFIDIQGKVDPNNDAYVAPNNGMGGVVKALYVKQGQNVSKGQQLAKLDDQLIRQQIEPLRVQLNSAEDTYRRTKNLWDQGIGTYQQVLTAETQVKTLRENIATLQKQASLASVTAPFSGVADLVNIRVGENYNPQAIHIVNTGDLKLVAEVPENYLSKVGVGSKVQVVLPESNNRTVDATITTVQKTINPNSRSFQIEARLPAGANLRPNQLAEVKILDYSAANALVIPLNTVQTDEKGKYVFVLEKTGDKAFARKKYVTIGEAYGEGIEIKSGLAAGAQIVTEGYQDLYEGQLITTTL